MIGDLPKMGRTTFWKLMKSMGFQYKKTKGNREIMMERPDIVAHRHAHYTVSWRWYDTVTGAASAPKEAPEGKGKPMIVLHAGYKGGLLPDCACVFIGKTTSADYHDEMNVNHFEEWFEHQLLPNLPA